MHLQGLWFLVKSSISIIYPLNNVEKWRKSASVGLSMLLNVCFSFSVNSTKIFNSSIKRRKLSYCILLGVVWESSRAWLSQNKQSGEPRFRFPTKIVIALVFITVLHSLASPWFRPIFKLSLSIWKIVGVENCLLNFFHLGELFGWVLGHN